MKFAVDADPEIVLEAVVTALIKRSPGQTYAWYEWNAADTLGAAGRLMPEATEFRRIVSTVTGLSAPVAV